MPSEIKQGFLLTRSKFACVLSNHKLSLLTFRDIRPVIEHRKFIITQRYEVSGYNPEVPLPQEWVSILVVPATKQGDEWIYHSEQATKRALKLKEIRLVKPVSIRVV